MVLRPSDDVGLSEDYCISCAIENYLGVTVQLIVWAQRMMEDCYHFSVVYMLLKKDILHS